MGSVAAVAGVETLDSRRRRYRRPPMLMANRFVLRSMSSSEGSRILARSA